MDFFSDQLFCVTYYWPSVTCTALVYLLDTKPWPDIWTVIVALLYALFRVIGFVEHSFFLSKVDELVRGIAPLVYFASPSCFHVYVCTTIWILLLFSQNAFFRVIYHDCLYKYEIFLTLSIWIQPSKYVCISILARQFALFLLKQSPRFSNRLIMNRCPNIFPRFG